MVNGPGEGAAGEIQRDRRDPLRNPPQARDDYRSGQSDMEERRPPALQILLYRREERENTDSAAQGENPFTADPDEGKGHVQRRKQPHPEQTDLNPRGARKDGAVPRVQGCEYRSCGEEQEQPHVAGTERGAGVVDGQQEQEQSV